MTKRQQANYAVKLPWYIYDISNYQLITTPIIPGDIRDTKEIILAEQPIPGLNYSPISPGGGGNRKISFTLPLIRRGNIVGNVLMLKQFDTLRNQSTGYLGFGKAGQFTPTPKVLYCWGIGSVPLVWWVKKCDPTHKKGWINAIGQPQYSEIEFELWLDESDPIYRMEEIFRKVSTILGESLGGFDIVNSIIGGKPY
jgi:hypothetical protein